MTLKSQRSQAKYSHTARAALILLALQLLVASCQSSTPVPTEIPAPTNTPDPNTKWVEFTDPWGRYSLRYPPDWHLFPAISEEVGYPTTISTVNLAEAEEPSREVDVSPDEFYIWFTLNSTDAVDEMNLLAWTETLLHPGGNVVERTEELIASKLAVVELFDSHNGQRAKVVYFSTSSGVLTVFGQPWGNPKSELFDLLLTTMSFQE